jgi:hypothetical protein
MMRFQLRTYRIEAGKLDDFVREWRDLILPLRRRLGFSVVGPWVDPEESRFVWVIGYDGDIREANERYYRSEEREAMNPDPARLIVESSAIWLEPIGVT